MPSLLRIIVLMSFPEVSKSNFPLESSISDRCVGTAMRRRLQRSFYVLALGPNILRAHEPHWNWRMLRHIYVADRLTLNNRNADETKEIGVRMWRTAYPNSTGAHEMELFGSRRGSLAEKGCQCQGRESYGISR